MIRILARTIWGLGWNVVYVWQTRQEHIIESMPITRYCTYLDYYMTSPGAIPTLGWLLLFFFLTYFCLFL